MASEPPPSRRQVEDKFLALINCSESRDAVDRWAGRWVVDAEAVTDEPVWWALELLFGIDLPDWPGDSFLHSHEQVGEWLAEFRRRCANRPLSPRG